MEAIRPPTGSGPAPSYAEILADLKRRREMTQAQQAEERWSRLRNLKEQIDSLG